MFSRPVLGLGLVAGTTAIISAGYIQSYKSNRVADTEAKLTVIQAEKEANSSKIQDEKEANLARIQAEKEAKLAGIQAETDAYVAKAKARRWW